MNDGFAHGLAMMISIVLWVTGTFGAGIYVLRPLDRASRQYKAPVQFTIVDFLALTAHLSVPLGFVGPLSSRGGSHGYEIVLILFGCLSALLIWWGTVRTAARAGVPQPLKRFLMIGIVVPFTFVAAIIFGILLPYLACQPLVKRSLAPAWWLYVLAIALAVGFFICRRIVNWILAPQLEVVADSDPWAPQP